MVPAVSHFDAYLVTHPFTIETGHKALVFLNLAQHSNGWLARWAMRLQPYTFEIRHRPGPANVNADTLSRFFDSSIPRPSVIPRGGGDVRRQSPNMRRTKTLIV